MTDCPVCKSKNTKKMQMVWASGTRTGQSKSTGIGVSSRGTVGIGVGGSQSSSQSHLAAACAPPKKSKLPLIAVLILGFFIWLPIFQIALDGSVFGAVVGFPLLGAVSFGMFKLYKHLDKKNQAELEAYHRNWLCLKCGHIYQ